jgi:polysaccharide pyruvyl transferase WcaK-like protein
MTDKKKLLIGSFGAKNIGDEMILLAALESYQNSIVMTANAEYSADFLGKDINSVRPFPVGFNRWYKFISSRSYRSEIFSLRTKIDQIIFPGGGLFKNHLKAILIWFVTVCWCRVLFPNVQIIFMGQGVDWPREFWLQRIMRWSFMQAAYIGVRDEISARNLIKLGVRKKILLQSDTVENYFGLAAGSVIPDQTVDKKLLDRGSSSLKQKILINAAKPFDYTELIKKIEQYFGSNYELNFVVFAPSDLQNIPSGFIGDILQPQTFSDLKQIFSLRPVCIGQRFHFLIFGQKFGSTVYLLDVPYAPKTEILAAKHGIRIWGNLTKFPLKNESSQKTLD